MKLLLKYKTFSGALQFTIFIGVIIALLLAGLLLLQNTHRFFIQQSKATIENIQLANSGIHYLLKQNKTIPDTTTIDVLTNEHQKVEVQSSQWGIFEKAIVKATHREKVFYKSALMGVQMKEYVRPTLYMKDNFKPLVLVGKTILKGTVFAPSQGIRPGYIAGESYYGKTLVDGITKVSNGTLPKLKKNYKEGLETLLKKNASTPNNFVLNVNTLKVTNSFLKPTKIYSSTGSIDIKNQQLIGNIIIKSDALITIKKTSVLKDVLIIAPEVVIEDGTKGNFQVIAGKKISVGKECHLLYPSALVLAEEKETISSINTSNETPQITIAENSEIRGTICYLKAIKENDFKTQLFLHEKAIIKGEVYCEGNFELKGKVVGSVYTEQFIVNAAGSIFVNHIYNGQILDTNFPETFCGILFDDYTKGIAKWMY